MAYEDKDLNALFPTTNSGDIGAHEQRTAIDHLGGANQIRTSIRLEETDTCKTTIRLRTRAGNPDFIVEKVCSDEENKPVYMDSGVVDLLSVAPDSPLATQSSPLYYGTIQQTYFANEKLLGKIVPPSTTAISPPANATPGLSFTSGRGDLVGKKDAAAKCPASMFTGKARLYAQAQYGGDLRDWKWALDIPEGLSPRLVHDNGTSLHTNCGVYRDDKNNHWLIAIHPNGIRITKLVRDNRVQKLVAHLSDPAMSADHDKIEAYILAYSQPSPTMTFILDVSVPETNMLGYGWKFNWDGNKADIIRHDEGFPTHTSTHYRFTFFRDSALVGPNSTPEQEVLRWTATLSTVSGPHHWHNSKYSQVIANPDWITNTLSLLGTRSGGVVAPGAPIYCFYKRNDLEIINYTASGGEEALKYSRTASPTTWGPQCDWTSDGWLGMNATIYDVYGTFGTDGGEGEWRSRTHNPVTVGFTSTQADCVTSAQSYIYEKRSLGSKTFTGGGGGWDSYSGTADWLQQNFNSYTGASPVRTLSDGVELMMGSSDIHAETISGVPAGYIHTYFIEYVTLNGLAFESGGHTETAYLLMVVPFHDAEAAYLWGNKNTRRVADGFTGSVDGTTTYWARRYEVLNTYDDGLTYVKEYDGLVYGVGSGSYMYPAAPDNYYDEETQNTNEEINSVLITSNSGPVPFSPPSSLGPFFSGEDFVEQQFYTHSAAVGAAVYGHGAVNLEGFPVTFTSTSPPPFIGWA